MYDIETRLEVARLERALRARRGALLLRATQRGSSVPVLGRLARSATRRLLLPGIRGPFRASTRLAAAGRTRAQALVHPGRRRLT